MILTNTEANADMEKKKINGYVGWRKLYQKIDDVKDAHQIKGINNTRR